MTAATAPSTHRAAPSISVSIGMLLVAVLVPAVAFVVAFPARTDYVGHYLAGADGTALILAAVLALPGRRPWWVVAATGAAILAGVGTEATVFRLAIFDPVDLANQSLGALVVGGALIASPGSKRLATALLAVAVLLLAVVVFAVLSVTATVSRFLVPHALDGTVSAVEVRREKHPGVDDVWLIHLDDDRRIHVDASTAQHMPEGARVAKQRWATTLQVDTDATA